MTVVTVAAPWLVKHDVHFAAAMMALHLVATGWLVVRGVKDGMCIPVLTLDARRARASAPWQPDQQGKCAGSTSLPLEKLSRHALSLLGIEHAFRR